MQRFESSRGVVDLEAVLGTCLGAAAGCPGGCTSMQSHSRRCRDVTRQLPRRHRPPTVGDIGGGLEVEGGATDANNGAEARRPRTWVSLRGTKWWRRTAGTILGAANRTKAFLKIVKLLTPWQCLSRP